MFLDIVYEVCSHILSFTVLTTILGNGKSKYPFLILQISGPGESQ